jgi:hypothetical protein
MGREVRERGVKWGCGGLPHFRRGMVRLYLHMGTRRGSHLAPLVRPLFPRRYVSHLQPRHHGSFSEQALRIAQSFFVCFFRPPATPSLSWPVSASSLRSLSPTRSSSSDCATESSVSAAEKQKWVLFIARREPESASPLSSKPFPYPARCTPGMLGLNSKDQKTHRIGTVLMMLAVNGLA